MVKLDILSDPICPWCLIGKTWLDRALAAHPDHPFAIEWHPFQLNPDMPPEGMDRRAYLTAKFGGAEAAFEVYSKIAKAAEAAGLAIEWDRIARTPNTLTRTG
jgi:predicted DsbA family dithiol-disulfide isomerase